MKKLFTCQYTDIEILDLFKQAFREVLKEEKNTIKPSNSPPFIDSTATLNTKEVLALLRISAPTLIKIRKQQKIRANRVGNKYLYLRSEIDKILSPGKSIKN